MDTYEEGITPNIYQEECLRTEAGMNQTFGKLMADGYLTEDKIRLMNGLMGLNGEAGECVDILKKVLFQGHELDKQHLAEELGDVLWYVAISANAIGYPLESIMIMNRDKLRKRYPEGFEVERSVNRV